MISPAHHTTLGGMHPHAYRAMQELSRTAEEAVVAAGLDARIGELVKIRASQLNGCAYCLRTHTREALRAGETADRLALVAAWWECDYFDDVEQASLQLTERITDLTRTTSPRHRTVDLGSVLDRSQFTAVAWLAIAINAWNRIALTSGYNVRPPAADSASMSPGA